jgi:protein phosphatase
MVRTHNEDRYRVFPEAGLFLVADGMGGRAAGEVAAQMAVDLVAEPFVTRPPEDAPPESGAARNALVGAIERANREIHQAARRAPGWKGMGTTLAALLVCGRRAAVAHIGDSRVYRLRGRRLDLLTEDHSLWNECVRAGTVDVDHPEEFKLGHLITRALGTDPAVEVDARLVALEPGDTFLLCSDGLHGTVPHAELLGVLLESERLDDAADRLVQRANDRGATDNVTAVLIRWTEREGGHGRA